MAALNCSFATLASSGAGVFGDAGCPEAAVICGMNISRLLADATEEDLKEVCLSEEEYLTLHLGPPKSPKFLPVCVTYLFIFIVGVVGNSLTCTVILCYRVMQTPTNCYLLSLAVSDLLVLLLGMPLELYEMQQNYPFLFGEGGCYFKIFLFETVCFASILNVTALSVGRYLAVMQPLRVRHISTRAHVRRVIFMLWLLSMLCALPNTSVHGIAVLPPRFGREFPQSAICHVVKPTWTYNLIIWTSTLVFFVLPMLIISILYSLICLQLRRERAMTAEGSGHGFGPESVSESNKQRLSKRNLQVTKMLCVLVVVFGLCWAPFHADRLMWSYIDASSVEHLKIFENVHIISGVFFYLSSAVNPILYNLMSTRFREMFSHVMCSSKSWRVRSTSHVTRNSPLSKKMNNRKKSNAF